MADRKLDRILQERNAYLNWHLHNKPIQIPPAPYFSQQIEACTIPLVPYHFIQEKSQYFSPYRPQIQGTFCMQQRQSNVQHSTTCPLSLLSQISSMNSVQILVKQFKCFLCIQLVESFDKIASIDPTSHFLVLTLPKMCCL